MNYSERRLVPGCRAFELELNIPVELPIYVFSSCYAFKPSVILLNVFFLYSTAMIVN